MEKNRFGTLPDGREVRRFALQNSHGVRMECIEYGCRITRLLVPGARGDAADVVWGFDSLDGYEADATFQGAFVGRYANRIGGAAFEVGGAACRLLQNEGKNYLHGSLPDRLFQGRAMGEDSVMFTYTSPDGEDGFPGELWVAVTYTLTEENRLVMEYRAATTRDTHVNLTNHAYFNLAGEGDIKGHLLTLHGEEYLEVDEEQIPTGRLVAVQGGAFDFLREKPVGRDMHAADPQLQAAGGYDHCFVLRRAGAGPMALAAVVKEPRSGRQMEVYTTQPGVQLYTGNGMDGSQKGKGGRPMERYGALCLETQHFPDAPHRPEFPSTLLPAEKKYFQSTVLRFSW